MTAIRRQFVRKAGIALVLLLLVGWLAPSFFNAEPYRRRLEAALAQILGRPVSFGAISIHLLPRPGFTVQEVVVGENPAFGIEPFARVEQADCDLSWRSMLGGRMTCSRVMLEQAHLNLVHDASGGWNIEELLRRGGAALKAHRNSRVAEPAPPFDIEADDSRLDFTLGEVKIPLAVTDLRASLHMDAGGSELRFRLQGSPIRTDVPLPTPGKAELAGSWSANASAARQWTATLQTRDALLSDWLPLLTGHNPGVFGLFNATARLTGIRQVIQFEGTSQVRELHRLDQTLPSSDLPVQLSFAGRYDRGSEHLRIERVDLNFARSQIHVAGAVTHLAATPDFDVVVALERSHLEDLDILEDRLIGIRSRWRLEGTVEGMLDVRGTWPERQYGGFLTARDIALVTPAGTFSINDTGIRIDRRGALLSPTRIQLSSHLAVTAEGRVEREPGAEPTYAVTLTARDAPLAELIRLARTVGEASLEHVDARGAANATLKLTGRLWPLAKPQAEGWAEIRHAKVRLPGLTQPVQLSMARIRFDNARMDIRPLVVELGSTVFSGSVSHRGTRNAPWAFDLSTDRLDAGQASLWFDVLGRKPPESFFWRLPGIRSLVARREAASDLFSRLNAQGKLLAQVVTYRALALREVSAQADIRRRSITLSPLTFSAGAGKGSAAVQIDLTEVPASLNARLTLAGASLQALRPYLSKQLAQVRGSYLVSGRFHSRGLTRAEIADHLEGSAAIRLRNVSLGNFDPLATLQTDASLGVRPALHAPFNWDPPEVHVMLVHKRILLDPWTFDLGSTALTLSGSYDFRSGMNLDVVGHASRSRGGGLLNAASDTGAWKGEVRLLGPLSNPSLVRSVRLSEVRR